MRCSKRIRGTDDDLLECGKGRITTCTGSNAIGLQQDKTSSHQVSSRRQGHAGCSSFETSSTLSQVSRKGSRTFRDLEQRRPFSEPLETPKALDNLSCLK